MNAYMKERAKGRKKEKTHAGPTRPCRPSKPAPKDSLLYTSEGAWSGLAYSFGGLALQLGLTGSALQVLSDVRTQYDGTRRSPWNEIECGDHYTRQMGGFALFEIASGQLWDGPNGTLTYGPLLEAANFSGFSIVVGGWGQFKQVITGEKTTCSIVCAYGVFNFKKLRILSQLKSATVTIAGKVVKCTVTQDTEYGKQYLACTFADFVQVNSGDTLQAVLS
eukprot:m.125929 g.125929  ORF g.125929 m.125929 type:complete len:221 (-) comp19802_c0_seq1:33-695(-)